MPHILRHGSHDSRVKHTALPGHGHDDGRLAATGKQDLHGAPCPVTSLQVPCDATRAPLGTQTANNAPPCDYTPAIASIGSDSSRSPLGILDPRTHIHGDHFGNSAMQNNSPVNSRLLAGLFQNPHQASSPRTTWRQTKRQSTTHHLLVAHGGRYNTRTRLPTNSTSFWGSSAVFSQWYRWDFCFPRCLLQLHRAVSWCSSRPSSSATTATQQRLPAKPQASPKKKNIGQTVSGFDQARWERHRFDLVQSVNLLQFRQNLDPRRVSAAPGNNCRGQSIRPRPGHRLQDRFRTSQEPVIFCGPKFNL